MLETRGAQRNKASSTEEHGEHILTGISERISYQEQQVRLEVSRGTHLR